MVCTFQFLVCTFFYSLRLASSHLWWSRSRCIWLFAVWLLSHYFVTLLGWGCNSGTPTLGHGVCWIYCKHVQIHSWWWSYWSELPLPKCHVCSIAWLHGLICLPCSYIFWCLDVPCFLCLGLLLAIFALFERVSSESHVYCNENEKPWWPHLKIWKRCHAEVLKCRSLPYLWATQFNSNGQRITPLYMPKSVLFKMRY